MSSPSPLTVTDLSVTYSGQRDRALRDVSLSLSSGKITGIVGPNGAGKSTLIKAALGLIPSSSSAHGDFITFWGSPLPLVRQRIAYVPQRSSIDWDFPVCALDVVCMGLYGRVGWFKRLGSAHKDKALAAMERLNIADLKDRQIGALSGGQQQRVFLARALVQDASFYIMDEPLVGIDAVTEALIYQLLAELKEAGKTILMVHHDLQSAARIFDDVILLNKRILFHGPAQEALSPERLEKAYMSYAE